MNAAKIGFVSASLLFASVALAAVHPWGDVRSHMQADAPLFQGANVPADVRGVLEAKCGNCHSGRTRYPPYTRFAPVSWMVERDVYEGRLVFDMSQWEEYPAATRIDLLTRIGSESRSGEMPPTPYLILHRHQRLTADEQQLIYNWARAERRRVRQQLSANPEPPSTQNSRFERP